MLLEAALPDDPQSLRAMLVALKAEVVERDGRITELECARQEAEAELVRLGAIIAVLQRHRFGARSEQMDPDQLALALEEVDAVVGRVQARLDAVAKEAKGVRPRERNRGALPAHLERVEQVVDVVEKSCTCCGGALHVIGEDVAERLDVVPAAFRVLVTRRPRYGCRACEAAPVQSPAVPRMSRAGCRPRP